MISGSHSELRGGWEDHLFWPLCHEADTAAATG
jgi:hypothetical protein